MCILLLEKAIFRTASRSSSICHIAFLKSSEAVVSSSTILPSPVQSHRTLSIGNFMATRAILSLPTHPFPFCFNCTYIWEKVHNKPQKRFPL